MSDLILVHGLYGPGNARLSGGISQVCADRFRAVAEYGDALGVRHYNCVERSEKAIANRLLRLVRGTARPVDALEVIELDEETTASSLAADSTRKLWQTILGCQPYGLDPERSFLLMGRPRELISGSGAGRRVLWCGQGLPRLTQAEFVAHYTGHHGPLVAGYAQSLGICRYRQVASERSAVCVALRERGLGQSTPPPVFAELVMTTPPLDLVSLRVRRIASRKIKADEKRHIDFHRSMLLLA